MVYGLFRALPGDRLSCHRHRQYRFRRLDTSVGVSGPHVFAVRFSIIRPHALARMTPPRPLHPAPNVRDDREAPLLWEQDGETDKLIRLFGKSEYFFKRGWTAAERQLHLICPSGKIRCGLRRAESEIVVVRADLPDDHPPDSARSALRARHSRLPTFAFSICSALHCRTLQRKIAWQQPPKG
jgi:hypothetical protein